jgi:CheY-like chemotaxis protein
VEQEVRRCVISNPTTAVADVLHLLVDDEPDILSAWRLILGIEGYEVVCAGDGCEALHFLMRKIPNLVVTDWMRPRMDGSELCRRMKEQPELSNVPILVHLSAPPHADGSEPWDACFLKPARIELFLTAVKQLCSETHR